MVKKLLLLIIFSLFLVGCSEYFGPNIAGQAVAFECSSFIDGELSSCSEDFQVCADSAHETLEQYRYGYCYEDGNLELCVDKCTEDEPYKTGCVINCIDNVESGDLNLISEPESEDIAEEPKEDSKCMETDVGIKIYDKGTLTTPEGKDFTDFCVESEAYPYVTDGASSAAYEYYCFNNVKSSKNNLIDTGTIVTTCPFGKGCVNGACEKRKCNGQEFDMLIGTTKTVKVDGKEYVIKLNNGLLNGVHLGVSTTALPNPHKDYFDAFLPPSMEQGDMGEIFDGTELFIYESDDSFASICFEGIKSPKKEVKDSLLLFIKSLSESETKAKGMLADEIIMFSGSSAFSAGEIVSGTKWFDSLAEDIQGHKKEFILTKEEKQNLIGVFSFKSFILMYGGLENYYKTPEGKAIFSKGYDIENLYITFVNINSEIGFATVYYKINNKWKIVGWGK